MRLDDPTHQNDMPLTWYQNEFAAAGFRRDCVMELQFREHPSWKSTDWRERWYVGRKN
jgi:hypothetical protein